MGVKAGVKIRDLTKVCDLLINLYGYLADTNLTADCLIIPPANYVCGRVYCFHVVRPSIG